MIEYDDHEYLFEGFSLFSHTPLTSVSPLSVISSVDDDAGRHHAELLAGRQVSHLVSLTPNRKEMEKKSRLVYGSLSS